MRFLLLPTLLLTAACGRGDEPTNEAATGNSSVTIKSQWGSGRDRLCVNNDRAGLVVYAAEGDANCLVRGTASSGGREAIRIKPDGDEACTINARMDQGAVILGEVTPACAYYCGPKASYAGKRLAPSDVSTPTVDVAGDPLC